MKEFTVTVNAQITTIGKGDEKSITAFDEKKKKNIEDYIKKALEADDVVISDYKVFMSSKENE